MSLFKRPAHWRHVVGPSGAIADLVTVFRQAGENRWRIAALSAATTFCLFSVLWTEEASGPPPPPKITFIRTFAAARSDSEIAAENRANQRVQEGLRAEQAKRDADVREIYKTIGRYSGMDVDATAKRADADAAAEKRARDARIAAELAEQRRNAAASHVGK